MAEQLQFLPLDVVWRLLKRCWRGRVLWCRGRERRAGRMRTARCSAAQSSCQPPCTSRLQPAAVCVFLRRLSRRHCRVLCAAHCEIVANWSWTWRWRNVIVFWQRLIDLFLLSLESGRRRRCIMASCATATPVSSSTSTTLTVTDNAKKLARKDKESLCELDSQVKGNFRQFQLSPGRVYNFLTVFKPIYQLFNHLILVTNLSNVQIWKQSVNKVIQKLVKLIQNHPKIGQIHPKSAQKLGVYSNSHQFWSLIIPTCKFGSNQSKNDPKIG